MTARATSDTFSQRWKRLRTLWLAGWVVFIPIVLWAPAARGQGPVLPLPPNDQQQLAKYLGPNVVGAALPSDPITDPTTYFPLSDKIFVYQVTSGSNTGTTQNLGLKQSHRPTGAPAWRYELTPTLAAYINSSERGDL